MFIRKRGGSNQILVSYREAGKVKHRVVFSWSGNSDLAAEIVATEKLIEQEKSKLASLLSRWEKTFPKYGKIGWFNGVSGDLRESINRNSQRLNRMKEHLKSIEPKQQAKGIDDEKRS
jgi:hypothetical protein